ADFQGHPLVLVFFMGDFCAGCRQQLLELGAAEQAFAEAGAELLAVSADLPANAEKTARFLESKSVTGLQIAADPTLTAIEAFGVRMPGTRYAYHSVFLIDAKGTLRLVARGDHAPANLPSPAILLAELNALDSGPIP
ncbi:MAG TPA: peroxiredoxin family protein, partial [bacterium]|nr:peroxiredoxin family protein [bacterium]